MVPVPDPAVPVEVAVPVSPLDDDVLDVPVAEAVPTLVPEPVEPDDEPVEEAVPPEVSVPDDPLEASSPEHPPRTNRTVTATEAARERRRS